METSKTCSYCSKPDALKICGRCRNQPYCSLACQRSDWRRHKATCAPLAPPPPRRTNRLDGDAFRPVATKALATKNTAGCRVGLRNEGNTCYLTCVLQCLTYSPLAGYLLELDVDGSNNMMAELQSHIRKVWKRNELLSRTEPSRIGSEEDSDDSAETVACKTEDIDVARSLLKRTLHNGRMQDAHEALVDIQAQLLESCGAHKSLKGQALVDWERSTVVHDVFGSDLEHACVCSACGRRAVWKSNLDAIAQAPELRRPRRFRSPSTHVEMMLMLNATLGLKDEDFLLSAEQSIDKPWESRSATREALKRGSGSSPRETPPTSVEELLKLYFSTETIDDYACDECRERCRCDKVSGFRTTPNCLATYIDRQPQYNQLFGKLNRVVTFSETLDLAPFCVEPGADETYRLYAVVCHLDVAGSTFFGHYVCYVRDHGERWWLLDDESVRPVGWDAVRRVNPYMLFYARARPHVVFRAAPARPREGE